MIYVGGPVENASERNFLVAAIAWLETWHIPSIILANVEIGGRQIDCIVATASAVSVVEVKSSRLPLRGEMNGHWGRLSPSGVWTHYGNAWRQALDAKNNLRTAMQAWKEVGSFHPDGYVAFTGSIPEGSKLTSGNFKVTVSTTEDVLVRLSDKRDSPWSLADWEAFARSLALMPTMQGQMAAGGDVRAALDLLERYNHAVATEYGAAGGRWLPEGEEERADLLSAAQTGAGCFISGPSGCGKTLMAKWLTSEFAKAGCPTLFLAAKDVGGSWRDSLRREVGLLADGDPKPLYRALARADQPVYLVIDGLNEFGLAVADAQRGIRALARHFGARLVITAQGASPPEFGGLRSVTVTRPSLGLKKRIATFAGGDVTPTVTEVLTAVETGMEAAMVGQVGSDLRGDATRLLLIEQYIRKRLGRFARAGMFGLRRLAHALHEQLAFSMTETTFDELMLSQHLTFDDCDALFAAGLLARRSGRVSFSHEMIQNACAAVDLARAAKAGASAFGRRLSTPILEPIADDILAAIEDGPVCRDVLLEVTSPDLIMRAASGRLGAIAASCALDMLDVAVAACIAEMRDAQLALAKVGDRVEVGWEVSSRREWNPPEEARLQAIGRRAALGLGIGQYMALSSEMDARLLVERRRWADFAQQERYPIRSESFGLAYYGFAGSIGFTVIAQSAHPALEPASDETKSYEFDVAAMTSGQLLFFLQLRRRWFDADFGLFAEKLVYLLRERFKMEPYHVQLAILDAVPFARSAPKAALDGLLEAINALEVGPTSFGINSSLIDALKALGAIEDENGVTRAEVLAELALALTDNDAQADNGVALSLCGSMFDHPFDFIYAEEISELTADLRHRLYRRALGAADSRRSMNLDWLARQVASFEIPGDAPLMQSLTVLPSRTNPFPQDEWGAFAIATRFVGRHHADLASIHAETAPERCVEDIRSLIYAAEARRSTDEALARLAWRRLHEMPAQLVVGCLSELHSVLFLRVNSFQVDTAYPPLNLMDFYGEDCLKVSRQFIDEGVRGEFYHRVPRRDEAIWFAFDAVKAHGDRSDVDRLRARSRDHCFARQALKALKSLDTGASGFHS